MTCRIKKNQEQVRVSLWLSSDGAKRDRSALGRTKVVYIYVQLRLLRYRPLRPCGRHVAVNP